MKIRVYKESNELQFIIPNNKKLSLIDITLMIGFNDINQLLEEFGSELPEFCFECDLTIREKEDINKVIKRFNEKLSTYYLIPNFFYEPVNLLQWNMLEKVNNIGHIEPFLATSKMKVNDIILLHVGSQKPNVASGIYGVAKIIEFPNIYLGNKDDYCYNKLSIKAEIIKYDKSLLLDHKNCTKFITQFRTVHQINPQYNLELYNYFVSSL